MGGSEAEWEAVGRMVWVQYELGYKNMCAGCEYVVTVCWTRTDECGAMWQVREINKTCVLIHTETPIVSFQKIESNSFLKKRKSFNAHHFCSCFIWLLHDNTRIHLYLF